MTKKDDAFDNLVDKIFSGEITIETIGKPIENRNKEVRQYVKEYTKARNDFMKYKNEYDKFKKEIIEGYDYKQKGEMIHVKGINETIKGSKINIEDLKLNTKLERVEGKLKHFKDDFYVNNNLVELTIIKNKRTGEDEVFIKGTNTKLTNKQLTKIQNIKSDITNLDGEKADKYFKRTGDEGYLAQIAEELSNLLEEGEYNKSAFKSSTKRQSQEPITDILRELGRKGGAANFKYIREFWDEWDKFKEIYDDIYGPDSFQAFYQDGDNKHIVDFFKSEYFGPKIKEGKYISLYTSEGEALLRNYIKTRDHKDFLNNIRNFKAHGLIMKARRRMKKR